MRNVPSWDNYFFNIANEIKSRSKDPNTQYGSVIVDKNAKILGVGYNGFPKGVIESDVRWGRPNKYRYVVHSEPNAIINSKCDLEGSTLYVQNIPCDRCAGIIINSGIKNIVLEFSVFNDIGNISKDSIESFSDWIIRWNSDGCLIRSINMFSETGINIFFKDQPIIIKSTQSSSSEVKLRIEKFCIDKYLYDQNINHQLLDFLIKNTPSLED